jgi:protein transport protein HofC
LHLLYTVLGAALVCWVGVMVGALMLSGILSLLVVLVIAGIFLFTRRHAKQQEALLWALAIAADRGMPLAPTLEALSGQCHGQYRRWVLTAAHLLRQGSSLAEVVDLLPGLFPGDANVFIRIGSETGVLVAALHDSSTSRAAVRAPLVALAIRISYLLWVFIVLQAIVGFISFFILPKYEAIFADFGVPLPSITLLTMSLTHTIIRYWYLFFLAAALQVGMFTLVFGMGIGILPWDLPVVGRFFLRHHAALVSRSLSHVVEADKPLDQALAAMARVYPVRSIRRRLEWVAEAVQRGDDWCEAMLDARLLRLPEAGLLESARRVGNLSWALRVAAENNERRFVYRIQWLAQWLLPVCVLAAGMVVFLVVVSYFAPLITLIERLAP